MGRLPRSIVPFLFLLAACRSFEVQRQQVFLRYQPEQDVLDVVLVYEGVGAPSPAESDSTTTLLEGMARGRRRFMIFDWPLDLDIDALLDGLRGEPIESEDDHAGSKRALLDYGENISSIEPRFLVDARKSEDDRTLCLLQHLRFAQASRMLHMLDLFVCEGILEDASHEGDGLSGEAGADALLLTRAKSGGSWIRFDGTVLEVSVPTTPGAAALQLKGLVESAASSPENARWLAQVLEPLSSFQVTADEMRLRFEPAKDGWIRFAFSDEERSYHPDVAEQLARQGLVVTDDLEAEIQRVKSKP